MGVFAVLLHEMGLDLGWVYLFMGVVLWNMMTRKKASGTGMAVAACGGLMLALIG